MKTKGYLSILILILALFGINWEPSTMPNQEIVVEFNDRTVTQDDACNAVSAVKERLELLGVQNIRVQEASNGRLKITYFSDVEVAVVKELLAEGATLSITGDDEPALPTELPGDSNFFEYELNISEIHKLVDIDIDGLMVEPAPDPHQGIIKVLDQPNGNTQVDVATIVERVAFQFHRRQSIHIDRSSRNIPDVRAGPLG
ncbi:MAG: hypothetical protein AAF466_08300 [Bacteroidota bacterium]